MCDRCAALEEEVTYLRQRLGERLSLALLRIVSDAFGLTPAESRLVVALYQARSVVPFPDLEDAVKRDPSQDYADLSNTVSVLIMRVRRATEQAFVVTHKTLGYSLGAGARAAIAAAVEHDRNSLPLPTFAIDSDPRPPTPVWDRQRRRELHKHLRIEGLSYDEAGVKLGVTRNAVASAAKRFGYQAGQS